MAGNVGLEVVSLRLSWWNGR